MKVRTEKYDVVVVGGGAAGIAAAVGAARRGARTLIVERYGFLGGEAANANVLSYCGFHARGDDCRQVVGGIGNEVLAALTALGLDVSPIRAPSGNWIIMLDPEAIKFAADRVVAGARVDTRLHCRLVQAHTSASRIESVSLHDNAGCIDVTASAFVDASGDANLGFLAGAPLVADRRSRQLASFPVRFGGVAPAVVVDRAELAAIMEFFRNDDATAYVRSHGGHFLRLPVSNDLWWMGIDLVTDGLDSADLGAAERRARELAWRFLELLRARLPGFANAFIAATGPQLGIRDSRQVLPRYRLTDDDVLSGRLREDGVALGSWPAEMHQGMSGPKFQPVGGSGVYHIPLASLRASGCDNLWLGGRVIGCDALVYGSLRVMGTAFATGHAAGVAAAHIADGGRAEEYGKVRAALQDQMAIL
jgi:hypothetical protein